LAHDCRGLAAQQVGSYLEYSGRGANLKRPLLWSKKKTRRRRRGS
jgi:hypothetical protein